MATRSRISSTTFLFVHGKFSVPSCSLKAVHVLIHTLSTVRIFVLTCRYPINSDTVVKHKLCAFESQLGVVKIFLLHFYIVTESVQIKSDTKILDCVSDRSLGPLHSVCVTSRSDRASAFLLCISIFFFLVFFSFVIFILFCIQQDFQTLFRLS